MGFGILEMLLENVQEGLSPVLQPDFTVRLTLWDGEREGPILDRDCSLDQAFPLSLFLDP